MKPTGPARRGLAAKLKPKKPDAIPAVLGDGNGNVETGEPNMVYVKVGDNVITVWNTRVSIGNDGIPVWIGFDPLEPFLLQVISTRAGGIDAVSVDNPNNVGPHAFTHLATGSDFLPIFIRALMPWKVTPTTLMNIVIEPAVAWFTGLGAYAVAGQVTPLDLSSHLTGLTFGYARYVLLTWSTTGTLVLTNGTPVLNASIAPSDKPAWPANTEYEFTAIRLYFGQREILEGTDYTDILDLRFPLHRIGDLGDMSKSVYDTDDDGVVDEAEVAHGLDGVNLDDLADVNAPAPTEAQGLIWDNSAQEWIAGDIGGSGHLIQSDGDNMPEEERLNFQSTPSSVVSVTDDPDNAATRVLISATPKVMTAAGDMIYAVGGNVNLATLALGAVATSSRHFSGFIAEQAIDLNDSTYHEVAYNCVANNDWWKVDLGAKKSIKGGRIKQGSSPYWCTRCDIYGSNDDTNWVLVADELDISNTNTTFTLAGGPYSYRYWRINWTAASNDYVLYLYTVELYDGDSPIATRLPLGSALASLRVNAGATAPEWGPQAVAGPASSTDNHLALFDGATDKLLKDGGPAGGTGVDESREINTTAPLLGGGDLSADRTLSIPPARGGNVNAPTGWAFPSNITGWVEEHTPISGFADKWGHEYGETLFWESAIGHTANGCLRITTVAGSISIVGCLLVSWSPIDPLYVAIDDTFAIWSKYESAYQSVSEYVVIRYTDGTELVHEYHPDTSWDWHHHILTVPAGDDRKRVAKIVMGILLNGWDSGYAQDWKVDDVTFSPADDAGLDGYMTADQATRLDAAVAGSGDMLKSVYDPDNDGKVEHALDADTLSGYNDATAADANTIARRTALGDLYAQTLRSAIATGDPPLVVESTTVVEDLNADQLDGNHASDFATDDHTHTGMGDVVGPASATDGHLAVFDTTTGKLIKDGGAVPAAGVTRAGATTDGHVALWDGSNADSIKDGGAPAGGGNVSDSGATTANHLAVWNGASDHIIKDGGAPLALGSATPAADGTGAAGDAAAASHENHVHPVGNTVFGPSSAPTDGHLALFDGTTGKLIKDGGAPSAGGGHTIQAIGVDQTARAKLNFKGNVAAVADNSGADSTDVTIQATPKVLTTLGDLIYASGNDVDDALASAGSSATASSKIYNGYVASRLIDGDDGTYAEWAFNDANEWIKVDLGSVKTIKGYTFKHGSNPYYTNHYHLEASNDNSNWTMIQDRNPTSWETYSYTFASPQSFRYWRITIISNDYVTYFWTLKLWDNDAPAVSRLPIGSEGQILKVVSGIPTWVTP